MSGSEGAGRGGRPLAIIFGIVALDLLGFGIVIPQLGIYAVEYQASPFVVGLLLSSYSVMQLLGAPLLGRISDAVGRRPVLLISLAGSVAGYLLFGFAHSLPLLFLSRIVAGLAGGNISTAQAYVSDVTAPEERARGMGIIGAAFGIGFVLGPAAGGALGSYGGERAVGLGAAALSLLSLAFALAFLPESRRPGSEPARREKLSAVRQALREPGLGLVLVAFFLFITAFAQMEGTFSVFLLSQHIAGGAHRVAGGLLVALPRVDDPIAREASWKAGLLFGVVGVVSAAVQGGLIGRLRRRFGEGRLARAGIAFTAIGLVLIPAAPVYAALFAPMAILALGSGLANPSLSALASLRAPRERQGEALGAYQAMGSLGRILGPILGGAVFDVGGPSAPYLVAAGMMVLALAVARRATPAAAG